MQHTTSRQALIDAHMNYVYTMAVRLYRQLARQVELGDLIASGTEGLLEAADRYDPERGASFATFAYYRIHGAMMDGVRKAAPLPNSVYQRENARMGRWEMRVGKRVPVTPERAACDEVETAEMCRKVRSALARLPERQRALLEQHYFADSKLCDAGARLGVSKSWATRLHARAIDSLRHELLAA